jgi:cyclopropane-fatty-acyl-phospholipid synthase
MKTKQLENVLDRLGISVNCNQPDSVLVNSPDFYKKVLKSGSLGFGEAYVDGLWDTQDLSALFCKITSIDYRNILYKKNIGLLFLILRHKLFNYQSISLSKKSARKHYNIGNDLYMKMLDPELNYSCAYWKEADSLEMAQQHKLDLICRKMNLAPGMRVLDVGCGWGSFARFAAKNYGVEVVGITLSEEQLAHCQERHEDLSVEYILKDYRKLESNQFDRIVSIGMFEHVGLKNFKTYFKKLHHLLKDEGLFLLHTIGSKKSTIKSDPWITRYIFPNGKLPSIAQTAKASEAYFCFEDLHNIGSDYDKTLMAWNDNCLENREMIETNYGKDFFRLWTYYLQSCAGAFRSRSLHLWQIVLSKKGVSGGYCSSR